MELPILLDACYVMLELDHTAGREITQCPWCGSYNRFTKVLLQMRDTALLGKGNRNSSPVPRGLLHSSLSNAVVGMNSQKDL